MQTIKTTSVNFLDKWQPLGFIGSGSTCDVLLVQDIKTQQKQVIKLYKSDLKASVAEAEAKMLLSLNHSRILSASGYFPSVVLPQSEDQYPVGGEPKGLPAIVLEWVPNGDLLGLIQSFGSLTETTARAYFIQLIDALGYLHEKSICHLDIKPDNILVDENYSMKLADLGVAMGVPKDCLVKGKVGTAPYHSPEMHLNLPYNAYQADLFALGITLFTMVSGNMPFSSAKATDQLYSLIIEENFEEFWAFHEKLKGSAFSQTFKNLIESMLCFDVKKRLSVQQIKKHAWVVGIVPTEECLIKLVTSALNKTTCAEEVKNVQKSCMDEELLSATC